MTFASSSQTKRAQSLYVYIFKLKYIIQTWRKTLLVKGMIYRSYFETRNKWIQIGFAKVPVNWEHQKQIFYNVSVSNILESLMHRVMSGHEKR